MCVGVKDIISTAMSTFDVINYFKHHFSYIIRGRDLNIPLSLAIYSHG